MVTEKLYFAFVALCGVQRLVELRISQKNAAWSFARGGIETGQKHFRAMALLHAGFLFSCMGEVWLLQRPWLAALAIPMFAFAVAAQALRIWVISTLGPRWNVRVIVVPGLPAISDGPYRWLRHPNYVAVIAEGIALPMIHSAYLTAILFTALNAMLLRTRIRCEEQALRDHCFYDGNLTQRPRFVPALGRAPGAT